MDVNSTATRFGEEEDEVIELELCLSLGGSHRKIDKPNPIITEKPAGHGGRNGFAFDVGGGACVDALSKREIHAVRRQEARKKREAKQQQRRGLRRPRNGIVWNSPAVGERDCKRMKKECNATLNGETNGTAVNLNVDQSAFSRPYPVSRIRCPHPYPVPNLSSFVNNPCADMVSFPFNGNDGEAKNPVLQDGTQEVIETNVGNGHGSGQIEDNVKPVSSSSGVTDPNCSPAQGGSSSDSGTNSRQTKLDHVPVNDRPMAAELDETEQITERSNGSEPEAQQASNISRQTSVVARERGKPPKPPQNGNDVNRNGNGSLLPFAQMPCVATTGNGPEGKTVNGFLYRYSKSEISIVCVCHGRSFTPAEFIRHAGGTEVSHPLRHITVVSSNF